MPVIGERPRPRALFMGFNEEEISAFGEFFPTMQAIDFLMEVRQAEWDVLVLRGVEAWPDPHLCVLSFGQGRVAHVECTDMPQGIKKNAAAVGDTSELSPATEFIVPDDLHSDIARLVMNDVVPKLKSEKFHRCVGVGFLQEFPGGHGIWRFTHANEVAGAKFQVFVGSKEPRAFAGCFQRQGGRAQAWILPFLDLNVAAWIQVALKQWHKLDPERFPVDSGWERNLAWMTPVESALVERIQVVHQERRQLLARLDAADRELSAQLQAVSLEVDENERRLLTAQGAPLVEAVAKAFEELGFRVQDMDAVLPAKDKREDLRVSPPDREDWTAICEVKGYHKGAGVNDLQKLERFRGRFYKEKTRDPERCWYVANTFLKDDPSQRAKPLATNPVEVETFAEEGGLVLGTADLFRLVMDVRMRKLEAQEARHLLMEQTGFFSRTTCGQEKPKAG